MDVYKVTEGSIFGIIAIIVFDVIWASVCVFMISQAMQFEFFLSLMPFAMLIIGLVFSILEILAMKRYMVVIDNRIPGNGKVTSISQPSYSKEGGITNFKVEYFYRDERGVKTLCIAHVKPENYTLFYQGQNIPVLIGGRFSYPDLEELKRRANNPEVIIKEVVKKVPAKEVYKTCIYCGGKVKGPELSCPHCGGNDFE